MHSMSPYSVPMTDATNGLTHQVYDLHLHAQTASKPLQAVCGSTIMLAPMVSPTGRPCMDCERRVGYLFWDAAAAQPSIRQWLSRPFRTLALRRSLRGAPEGTRRDNRPRQPNIRSHLAPVSRANLYRGTNRIIVWFSRRLGCPPTRGGHPEACLP